MNGNLRGRIVDRIIKTIAKQANLDRVLFTPALKSLYFSMAMASGGATQFKHAETMRKGLHFAADKVDDKKHVLLFCSVTELIPVYDLLLPYAEQMLPLVVLALRSGTEVSGSSHWSVHELAGTGWLVFHTHTQQELYNHLAMAYYLFEEKQFRLPVLVMHSAPDHPVQGDFIPREDLNLGNPLTGLTTSRKEKKLDFDAALKAIKQKKEKPSLRGTYCQLVPLLRECYETLGYALPEAGLPYAGATLDADHAIVTSVPPASANATCLRLLCYRPLILDALLPVLQGTQRVAVVEPQPSPGVTIPPFYGEIAGALPRDWRGELLSVCTPSLCGTLHDSQLNPVIEQLRAGHPERFFMV
ncbi:MAG: hypothetical protein RBU29_15740 [bacterium]|jgi:hypothetical protein|nr:hypothetical protein [bacterium]